jgi:FixJ family two-component response regulator
LPGFIGLQLQRRLADAAVHIPIVSMTGHGDIPMTVKAMKAGAVEFLTSSIETSGAEAKSARPALVAIVDDDESVRDAISSLFRSMGYRTELFLDGMEFLAVAHLRNFSCVILDMHMPGMDGLELQRR